MKKLFLILLSVVLSLSLLAFAGWDSAQNTETQSEDEQSIVFSSKSVDLKVGEEFTISYNVDPVDSTITWTSMDTNVATVDSNGKVTAVGIGSTRIWGTVADYVKAYCLVTVEEVLYPAYNVQLDDNNYCLFVGESYTIPYSVFFGSSVLDTKVNWTSSNDKVASVVDGLVTPKKAGTAIIKAEIVVGEKSYFATATVEVLKYYSITLEEGSLTYDVGDKFNVTPIINNGEKNISYSLDDVVFSSVDSSIIAYRNGGFLCKKPGTTTILVDYKGVIEGFEATVDGYVLGDSILESFEDYESGDNSIITSAIGFREFGIKSTSNTYKYEVIADSVTWPFNMPSHSGTKLFFGHSVNNHCYTSVTFDLDAKQCALISLGGELSFNILIRREWFDNVDFDLSVKVNDIDCEFTVDEQETNQLKTGSYSYGKWTEVIITTDLTGVDVESLTISTYYKESRFMSPSQDEAFSWMRDWFFMFLDDINVSVPDKDFSAVVYNYYGETSNNSNQYKLIDSEYTTGDVGDLTNAVVKPIDGYIAPTTQPEVKKLFKNGIITVDMYYKKLPVETFEDLNNAFITVSGTNLEYVSSSTKEDIAPLIGRNGDGYKFEVYNPVHDGTTSIRIYNKAGQENSHITFTLSNEMAEIYNANGKKLSFYATACAGGEVWLLPDGKTTCSISSNNRLLPSGDAYTPIVGMKKCVYSGDLDSNNSITVTFGGGDYKMIWIDTVGIGG